jgi:branched-chain amino acid transport system ATP-binding protein
MELLKVEKVSKHFGGLQALHEVSMSVEEGEIVSIIGPNGSGKTTLFNIITGVHRPTKGNVIYKGENITFTKTYKVISKGISRVFQLTSLFPNDTVLQNVIAGSYSCSKIKSLDDFLNTKSAKQKRQERKKDALQILCSLNMIPLKDKIATSLPYGSQRLLALAIARSNKPKLMLLDEPLCGMNPNEKTETIRLIKQIHNQDGVSILLVEHDMKSVMGLSDKIVVLNFGQKIAEGKPEEIRKNLEVLRVYLGVWFDEKGNEDAT